ncbi:YozE family protein [Isobaculum melis]|uniref:UPF0346 protein SAMN04488559_105152 n=1 Tax=Isobaculum melis TaxID=142588 RepID=A0A1H9RWQ8_9LACT|nr:YozE family protein [Isobaculum melis]SER77226.1 Uncharacterized protein YozE, UPF0346 family [Isobaculum melis]
MRRSFYHYLMTQRDPHKKDAITLFANDAYLDVSFPKQSESYLELTHYLEISVDYLPSMTIFDEAWEAYLHFDQ